MSLFVKGNPYHGCVVCQYDSHCPPGAGCNNGECEGKREEVPPQFVSVGPDYYLISEEKLPWPQAQYDCMSREGRRHAGKFSFINFVLLSMFFRSFS